MRNYLSVKKADKPKQRQLSFVIAWQKKIVNHLHWRLYHWDIANCICRSRQFINMMYSYRYVFHFPYKSANIVCPHSVTSVLIKKDYIYRWLCVPFHRPRNQLLCSLSNNTVNPNEIKCGQTVYNTQSRNEMHLLLQIYPKIVAAVARLINNQVY